MITIYHKMDLFEKVPPAIEDQVNLNDYEKVAEINTTELDDAWTLTNTVEVSWPDKKGVKNLTGKGSTDVRSTSVGDLMITGNGDAFLVDYTGFKPVVVINE